MNPYTEFRESDDKGLVPLSPGGDEELFLEEQPLNLTLEDQLAFVAALENPTPPNAALRGLMGGPIREKAKK